MMYRNFSCNPFVEIIRFAKCDDTPIAVELPTGKNVTTPLNTDT